MKKKETEFLTENEAQAMFRFPDRRTLQGKRDYAILLTLLTTGLRSGLLKSSSRIIFATRILIRGRGQWQTEAA
jgi:hypothetical protein